jgi:hypothetical protein
MGTDWCRLPDRVQVNVKTAMPKRSFYYDGKSLTVAEHAKSGQYLGAGPVLGTLCHHVAFHNEGVDWQVWIQDGPRPLVRKAMMVSTDPEVPARLTVNFKDWDPGTKLPDFLFSYDPPADAMKIEVLPIEVPAANEAKSEKPAK